MKTNRELLELAAKANSMTEFRYCDARRGMAKWENSDGGWFAGECWNPLTDDGDALRLAVKLGFWITLDTETEMTVDVIKATRGPNGKRPTHHIERFKYPQYGDAYAATRRAIVRAAAEIGEDSK